MTKTSPTFVGKVRAEKEATGDVSTVDTRTDTKGRKQPAKRKSGTTSAPRATSRGIATALRDMEQEAIARKSAEPAAPERACPAPSICQLRARPHDVRGQLERSTRVHDTARQGPGDVVDHVMTYGRLLDYDGIKALGERLGRPVSTLIAQGSNDDPFYADMPSRRERAHWFKKMWDRLRKKKKGISPPPDLPF
jgi:hypothetical protein